MKPEFDQLASSYEQLLRDPIRDRFSGPELLFFHLRKRDLLRAFFRRRHISASSLRYLDVGCGKGELLGLLRHDFGHVAGCDVSADMMREISGIETRTQTDPAMVPFADAASSMSSQPFASIIMFVPILAPLSLRRSSGSCGRVEIFCMIEHNPINPITRLIVSRTPIDADAILLRAREAEAIAAAAGLHPMRAGVLLYFPQFAFRYLGGLEPLLASVPLGGHTLYLRRRECRRLLLRHNTGRLRRN